MRRHLLKLGGSLLDLADLAERVRHYCAGLESTAVLIFPGGGRTADAVRELDRLHGLGDETAHWLAVRSLTVNAHFLAKLLGWEVTQDPFQWREKGGHAVVDPLPWVEQDEANPERCPHRWEVTSDSLALRLGQVLNVDAFHLLKSRAFPSPGDWHVAARLGLVDEFFPTLAARRKELEMRWVDLRGEGGS